MLFTQLFCNFNIHFYKNVNIINNNNIYININTFSISNFLQKLYA